MRNLIIWVGFIGGVVVFFAGSPVPCEAIWVVTAICAAILWLYNPDGDKLTGIILLPFSIALLCFVCSFIQFGWDDASKNRYEDKLDKAEEAMTPADHAKHEQEQLHQDWISYNETLKAEGKSQVTEAQYRKDLDDLDGTIEAERKADIEAEQRRTDAVFDTIRR